jgi:putative redox protein
MAKARAIRRQGYAHDVEVAGHKLVFDEPESAGGTNQGPSPTRMLAGALAACTAITVEMYAERKGWDLGDVEVDVEMECDGPSPKAFEGTVRVPTALEPEQQERLRVIAGKCPVHRALSSETEVAITDVIDCD